MRGLAPCLAACPPAVVVGRGPGPRRVATTSSSSVDGGGIGPGGRRVARGRSAPTCATNSRDPSGGSRPMRRPAGGARRGASRSMVCLLTGGAPVVSVAPDAVGTDQWMDHHESAWDPRRSGPRVAIAGNALDGGRDQPTPARPSLQSPPPAGSVSGTACASFGRCPVTATIERQSTGFVTTGFLHSPALSGDTCAGCTGTGRIWCATQPTVRVANGVRHAAERSRRAGDGAPRRYASRSGAPSTASSRRPSSAPLRPSAHSEPTPRRISVAIVTPWSTMA